MNIFNLIQEMHVLWLFPLTEAMDLWYGAFSYMKLDGEVWENNLKLFTSQPPLKLLNGHLYTTGDFETVTIVLNICDIVYIQ